MAASVRLIVFDPIWVRCRVSRYWREWRPRLSPWPLLPGAHPGRQVSLVLCSSGAAVISKCHVLLGPCFPGLLSRGNKLFVGTPCLYPSRFPGSSMGYRGRWKTERTSYRAIPQVPRPPAGPPSPAWSVSCAVPGLVHRPGESQRSLHLAFLEVDILGIRTTSLLI